MRTLNIISHILEDSHPTTSGSKPGLPSLSPIKRHGSNAGKTTPNELPIENKAGRGMSPIKNIIHGEFFLPYLELPILFLSCLLKLHFFFFW